MKTVENIAHSYLQYRIVDKNHDFFQSEKNVGDVLESYCIKEPTALKNVDGVKRTYPTGTWMLTTRVTDPETVRYVEKGYFKGYSVTALSKNIAEQLVAVKEHTLTLASKERVNIADLVEPVAYTVSIVRKPCQPGAKFCSIKGVKKEMTEPTELNEETVKQGVKSVLRDIFSSKKEEPEYITKEELEGALKAQEDTITSKFDEVLEALKNTEPTEPEEGEGAKKEKKEEEEEEEEVEEPKKKKTKKAKGKKPASKQVPQHNNTTPQIANKADTMRMKDAMSLVLKGE